MESELRHSRASEGGKGRRAYVADEDGASRHAVEPRPPLHEPQQHRSPPAEEGVERDVHEGHDVACGP